MFRAKMIAGFVAQFRYNDITEPRPLQRSRVWSRGCGQQPPEEGFKGRLSALLGTFLF